ncbi:hypothetical protein [Salinicola acroporae]|uniref:hypothetical protein n=1 Tax=Salinicola acroporae TaxID=1541440 RepID=UPI00197E91AA|nr:hypothetical protein [Salinicola acroporae]
MTRWKHDFAASDETAQMRHWCGQPWQAMASTIIADELTTCTNVPIGDQAQRSL